MLIVRYTARRIVLLLPVLFGVLVFTFILVRVTPGDPIASLMPAEATHDQIQAARKQYGLDDPIPVQFLHYVEDIAKGNLGKSFQTGRPITTELLQHVGPTFELVTCAFVLALLIGISLGVLSALKFGRLPDHAIRFGSLAAGSFSEFWLGLILILVFYFKLGLAPTPRGRFDAALNLHTITHIDIVDALVTGNFPALSSVLGHLVLPVATLAIVMSPGLVRVVRASAIDVLRSEAYLCVVAHGVRKWRRVLHYVVRQSMLSIPTLGALIFGQALGGAVLVETVFSWDGLGQWALHGMQFRDYPIIQTFVLMSACVYVGVFLVADVVHAVLDPRVRL